MEMADSSAPTSEKLIKFPCLQYLTEFTGFAPDFDYVRSYEIPPNITSIEWLNRSSMGDSMTFVVANDKKIRLFKLHKDFTNDFRGHAHENQ